MSELSLQPMSLARSAPRTSRQRRQNHTSQLFEWVWKFHFDRSCSKWLWHTERKTDFTLEANHSCIKTPFPSCSALKHLPLINYSCLYFRRLMNSWLVLEVTQRAGFRSTLYYPLLHLIALGLISNILLLSLPILLPPVTFPLVAASGDWNSSASF